MSYYCPNCGRYTPTGGRHTCQAPRQMSSPLREVTELRETLRRVEADLDIANALHDRYLSEQDDREDARETSLACPECTSGFTPEKPAKTCLYHAVAAWRNHGRKP